MPGSRLPTSRSSPAARAAPSVAISMASSGAIGWPASAARWSARNGASPDRALAGRVGAERDAARRGGASPGMRVGSRSGVPFWRYASGHQTIDRPVPRIGATSPSRITFMWTKVAFGPSTPSSCEVGEARPAPARFHGRRHVEVVAEVGVQHDALAVGERLGRAEELVGRRALAVERDVAVHDAVGIAVPAELPARGARATARASAGRARTGSGSSSPGSRPSATGRPRGRDRRASSARPSPARRRRRRRARRRSPAPRTRCSRGAGARGSRERPRPALVLGPERGLPVGVVRPAAAALAAVALEEAAAGLRVDVEVRVDEPRVDDAAARVERRGRAASGREDLGLRARPRRSCGPAPRRRPAV